MFLTLQGRGGGEGAGCAWGVGEAGSMFVILNVRQKPEKSSHPDVF